MLNLSLNKTIFTQHSTAQHSTAQHSTAQHSTAQHSTAKPISSFSFITYFPLEKPCPSQEQAISLWQKHHRQLGNSFLLGKTLPATRASHFLLEKALPPTRQAISIWQKLPRHKGKLFTNTNHIFN